jgi:uncharacterized damage-inducible protein DinB
MAGISKDIAVMILREIDGFQREIELFPDDESVWRTLPGLTNSAGNLALHVCGNLRHFVGDLLGGKPYVRNRELEFGRRSGTRQDLVTELKHAAAIVREVLPGLTEAQLNSEFEPMKGRRFRTGLFLTHLCAHTAYHLGQAGYARRAVTGDSRSAGALPLDPMVNG